MKKPIRVLNSVPVWLPLTSPWLFNQVRLLPAATIQAGVVAEQSGAGAAFVLGTEHYFSELPRARQLLERAVRKLGLVRQLPFFREVVRTFHPDILHSHWGDQGWRDSKIARESSVRHVVTYYGKDVGYFPKVNPIWRHRYSEVFAHCTLILCEGPFMADEIHRLGCPREKLVVHRLGVIVDKIAFRHRYRRNGEPLRILLAASFREKKGLTYALDAVGRVQSQLGSFEITIIGDASADPRSVPEKRAILDMIDRHGLASRVRLLGYQPYSRLLEEAYQHHVFMSPSVTATDGDTEGGAPVTLIDMAATGILIISTTHCDIPQIVSHGITGLLAPERDVATLAEHLIWLVENPQEWMRYSNAGRDRVEQMFDATKQAKALADIYASL